MAAEQQRPPVAPYVVYHAFRPQVAVYSSPDVDELARANGLQNLAQLLKPWEASVERVTLRTSTFVSHVVPAFPLLIDDARDIVHTELDALFLDGLSESITQRVPEWLESMDPIDVHDNSDEDLWKEGTINELTPWYGYYRDALVNLRPRTEYETFGHPVSCIIAVSTSNPEPLNAFAELYEATSPERLFADKPWVDPNVLRYYVLVHDATTGPAEDFVPLLEDIRRAYGLHTNMLVLNSEAAPKPDSAYMDASQRPLPKPADFSKHWTDIPSSPTVPRFESRPPSPAASTPQAAVEIGAKLGEEDVRRIKLFLREFVVQNLAPWLERTTTTLNEQLAANRKGIAGRLFSAGRRYFGSRPASPAPGAANASAFDPIKGFYRHTSQEAQTRRLADFALMIADYRLAAANYEIGRKDFLNDKAWRYYASATRMTGLLNLLMRKSVVAAYNNTESDQYLDQAASVPASASAQLDALRAIALYYEVYQEQEDWRAAASALAKFASDIDELPSALMLEQAGMVLLRLEHPARRRFSLLMTIAAHRYQKTGPKTLADRCGRQALSLFSSLDRRDWIIFRNHLERMLGRQAFNDGKAEVALVHFLRVYVDNLPSEEPIIGESQDFLDDLQLAWTSLGSNADELARTAGLSLPEPIFDIKRTAIHSEVLNPAAIRSDTEAWLSLDHQFAECGYPYTPEGSETAQRRPLSLLQDVTFNIFTTGENINVDLWANNTLDVPIVLSDVELHFDVEGGNAESQTVSAALEALNATDYHLEPRSLTKITIQLKAALQGSFVLKTVQFRYNHLLLCKEDLSRKGVRLHATKAQMLEPTYAEDASLKVVVKPPQPRLQVYCKTPMSALLEGEIHTAVFVLRNTGSRGLRDLRVLCDKSTMMMSSPDTSACQILVDRGRLHLEDNTLRLPKPTRITLPEHGLEPGEETEWRVHLRGAHSGTHKLRWLFTFYDSALPPFEIHTACHSQDLEVIPFLEVKARLLAAETFHLSVEVSNRGLQEKAEVLGVSILSPVWAVKLPFKLDTSIVDPLQASTLCVPLDRLDIEGGPESTVKSTVLQLEAMLHGRDLQDSLSSSIDLAHSSTSQIDAMYTLADVCSTRTQMTEEKLIPQFPSLDVALFRKVFPLYNPGTLDVLVSWRLPQSGRQGWHYLGDVEPTSGAEVIRELVQRASGTLGAGRSEESAQDRTLLIQHIERSDYARSHCPLLIKQTTNAPDPEIESGSCTFLFTNCGLRTVSCTLELLSGISAHDSQRSRPVRWRGRLRHHCDIEPGAKAQSTARYAKPLNTADQGLWQATITCGNDIWYIAGCESLVAG